MDKELIYRLALQSELIVATLSSPDNPMTDYGSCQDELLQFAALIAEECAKTAENVLVPFSRDDGESRAAAAIREQFKP